MHAYFVILHYVATNKTQVCTNNFDSLSLLYQPLAHQPCASISLANFEYRSLPSKDMPVQMATNVCNFPYQEHKPKNIYIIGAQCTGKTTLVLALEKHFEEKHAAEQNTSIPKPLIIKEVARNVLREHNFKAEDITNSKSRALELQKLILNAQYEAESAAQDSWFISDRSGLDCIVYARRYVGVEDAAALMATPLWRAHEERMRDSLVVVCETGVEWLIDDGVRLMPESPESWDGLHALFCSCLDAAGLRYEVLSNKLLDLGARVEFVLGRLEEERLKS